MLKWINKKRNKKGFTLVELVVVIAILGILAAIAVPRLSRSRENAAIAAHNANVRTLESAATLAVSEGSDSGTWEKDKLNDKWENYLQSWPVVPTGVANRKYEIIKVDEDGKEVIGTDGKPETEEKTIDGEYKVEIKESGAIIVTPGKISNEKLK